MPLICQPLTQEKIVRELLKATIYGRQQVTGLHFPKQSCLTHLHQMLYYMWLGGSWAGNTSGWALFSGLDLMGKVVNNGLCLLKTPQSMIGPGQRIYLPDQCLIKACFDFRFNLWQWSFFQTLGLTFSGGPSETQTTYPHILTLELWDWGVASGSKYLGGFPGLQG